MEFLLRHKVLNIVLFALTIFIYIGFTRPVDGNKLVDKNDPNYVNRLYISDQRIYEKHLNDIEKQFYDKFKSAFLNYEDEFEVNFFFMGCEENQECITYLTNGFDALLIDHPEILNLASYAYSYDTKGNCTIKIHKAIPFKLIEKIGIIRIEKMIDDVKRATKHMSDEEKIKYVYNYIGTKAYYDKAFTYSSKNQSAFNFFINDNAVCAGFAKSAQIVFQNIGIESYTITGYTSARHMWNIVKYNDKYYYLDTTVANSAKVGESIYYEGLNQEFMNDYKVEHSSWYPRTENKNMFKNLK